MTVPHGHSGTPPKARLRASSTRYGGGPGIQFGTGFRVRAFGAPRNDRADFFSVLAATLFSFFALTTVATAQPSLQCSGNQKPWMVAELLFGRSNVSDFNWDRFLAAEVTPRFPDGLTVYDARGQWKNPQSGSISRERSKVVMIAMPPDAGNDAKLQEIIAAYKTRFKQQSVGMITRPSCVSF